MSIRIPASNTADMRGAPDVFMTRQPVLDRNHDAAAFELLFQPADMPMANHADCIQAGAAILEHFIDLDLLRVIGEASALIDLDASLLSSDLFMNIPRNRFIFAIDTSGGLTDEAMQRMAALAGQGFRFAVDAAAVEQPAMKPVLSMAEVVRFDLRTRTLEELVQATPRAGFADKKQMVAGIDTLARFDACLALGFDLFQGDYFRRPAINAERQLAPSQLAILDVIRLIGSDADNTEIEEHLKRDVSLSLNLLRLVNTAAVGAHRIDSLRQALMVLGRMRLASWLQIMLYAQARENTPSVKTLLMLATTRGKLMELIAYRRRPGNRGIADTAFTVGIMSLMDLLFGMPMTQILEQIAVSDEVSDALLERAGYHGELLSLVEASEQPGDVLQLPPLLQNLQMGCADLFLLQAQAFDWSNGVLREMRQ